jgi:ATP-dependent exoDNAse (exonuclease V) beta subunit
MNHANKFDDLVMRASAGTGKTFQLSNRYLGLAASGAPVDHILATTFTRKAAGEILDRVLIRVAEASLDDAKRAELTEHAKIGDASAERCLALLESLTSNLHRLRVCTLDSFFAQIATSFALELGLPPSWRIVDELEDAAQRSEAIGEVLQNDETGEVIRLMHLLSKGEVTRSVADQIRGRVDGLYDLFMQTPAEAWDTLVRGKSLKDVELAAAIETLEAIDLSDAKAHNKGRTGDLERIAAGDWNKFISTGIAAKLAAGESVYNRKPISDELAAAYRPLLDHAKALLIGRLADHTVGARALLEKFHAVYDRLKTERGSLRFEDVTRAVAGAVDDGLTPADGFRLDGEVAHLLLDEFQDTSLAQWQAVSPLAERVVIGGAADRSFFCVGDVKQAIYGWRGGVAEIFDELPRQLPGLREADPLLKSYRSCQVVIDVVNDAFGSLTTNAALADYPHASTTWAERFQKHETARSELAGHVTLTVALLPEEGESAGDATLRAAADLIAQVTVETPRATVGVLVRTNDAVGHLITLLRRRNVPASEEGGNPLSDSPAVEVILSLLRLADHPGDKVSRFHVANSPLGPALDLPRHDDDAAAARLSHDVRRTLVEGGYGPSILRWVQRLAPSCDSRDLRRLMQLVELAHRGEDDATVRTGDFVRWVESQSVDDPTTASVRVMTVYQAKGLQFDVVVLPELDKNLVGQPPAVLIDRPSPTAPIQRVIAYPSKEVRALLPQSVRDIYERHVSNNASESLSVLYVAMTRAVHTLHMLIRPSRKSEKTMPKTFAGLLRDALSDGAKAEPGQVLYDCGDPDWHVGGTWHGDPIVGGVSDGDPVIASDADQPASIRLAPAPKQRRRGLSRQSPSGLEGGHLVNLGAQMQLDQSIGMSYGTLIHAWFEQITWLDGDSVFDEATLREIAADLASETGPLDVDRVLSDFQQMLSRPKIRAALSRSFYTDPVDVAFAPELRRQLTAGPLMLKVHNERPFALRQEDTILRGTIDRLVEIHQDNHLIAVDILDFKTDTIDSDEPNALKDKADHYRPQIEAYRAAVAQMTGLSESAVTARLLFVGVGECQYM